MLLHGAVFVFLLGAGSRLVASYPTTSPQNSTIPWGPCTSNTSAISNISTSTCGTLAVPLDYTDTSCNTTLDLHLLKFDAVKQPAKGSILFNPGGPGESTLEFLGGFAELMMIATSGYYNLIAFDTRGVGETLPFSCFDDASNRTLSELSLPSTSNNSDVALGTMWSMAGVLSDYCYENAQNKDIGELMSTAFIARDMMQIVDAMGEDGLLRYYGFSYGTVLGATVAAMFPDRMDKVVLDGVVNIHEWLNGRNGQLPLQADDAVRAYFKSCLEDQDNCAIQRTNTTTDALYNEVVQLVEEAKYNPIILGNNLTTGIIDHGILKTNIYAYVKTGMGPTAAGLATYLNAIMERDWKTYQNITAELAAPSAPIFPNNGPEALYGIQCPDTELRFENEKDILPLVEYNYNESYFGGVQPVSLMTICLQWKMRSKETFTGPFTNIKTKNPILFVSSPLDPATPMASARNMSQGFEGSVVLQQNGIGHCSLAQPSSCTIKATAAYFENGTLPQNGTVCEPNFGFLSNHTVAEPYLLAAS